MATSFDSDTKKSAVHRLSKQLDLYHCAEFTSFMLWMVMGCLYLLMNMVLVVGNSVRTVLGLCDDIFFRKYVVLLMEEFMASAV